MGFFERISRSPAEKKYAAVEKQRIAHAKAKMPHATSVLPEYMEAAKEAFTTAHVNGNWAAAANSAKKFRDMAKDAQSVPAFAMGAELHAKAYIREIMGNWKTHPASFTMQNLKTVWYFLVEDLEAIDLGTRQGGASPDSLSDVIGLITELEKVMFENFNSDSVYEEWKKARVYSRQRTPVIPPLKED